MLTENETPKDTAQLKITWLEKRNSLLAIHSAIKDIDGRLASWGLAIWGSLGLGPSDVKEERELYILPNSKLSKNDLQHKKALLQYKADQLEAELKSIQATAKQLQANEVSESDRIQDQYIKQEQDQALELYTQNKVMFFAEVLFDPQIEWAQQKEQIYHSANKILAVCPLFSQETDRNHLWQSWKIVSRARDIEIQEQSTSNRYVNGAEKFMRQIVFLLPIEMQGLKLLYNAKDYDRVDYYLSEVYVTNVIEEDEPYAALLRELIDEIDRVNQKRSNVVLAKNPLFNKLPKPVKDQLIAQYSYTTQANFYLSLVDNSVWHNYVKILESNINSVINKTIAATDCENEFNVIKKKIVQNVQDKLKLAKMDMEEDFIRVNLQLRTQQKGSLNANQ